MTKKELNTAYGKISYWVTCSLNEQDKIDGMSLNAEYWLYNEHGALDFEGTNHRYIDEDTDISYIVKGFKEDLQNMAKKRFPVNF